jgi:hypothetical protein
MAIRERSAGPLYLARVKMAPRRVPVHAVGIHQMHPPWRRGRAVVFPSGRHYGLVLGWWTRTIEKDIEEDFADDRWFDPKWLDTTADDISTWKSGHEETEEQAET